MNSIAIQGCELERGRLTMKYVSCSENDGGLTSLEAVHLIQQPRKCTLAKYHIFSFACAEGLLSLLPYRPPAKELGLLLVWEAKISSRNGFESFSITMKCTILCYSSIYMGLQN
jgi:hypothetical protein